MYVLDQNRSGNGGEKTPLRQTLRAYVTGIAASVAVAVA